jgi:maleylpyruvate isomerase
VETPQYANRSARDAEIEAGAHRSAAELLDHVRKSAGQFLRTVEELPSPAWNATIRPFTGELCTPRRILVIRLLELELHHVDLAVGYEVADVPASARDIVLDDVLGYYAAAEGVPDFRLYEAGRDGKELARFGAGGPVVSGERADILAWLAGRTARDGARLHTASGELPVLPPWI